MRLKKYFDKLMSPKSLRVEQKYEETYFGYQPLRCYCDITRDDSGMTFKFWDAHDTIVHIDPESCAELYEYMTEMPTDLMKRHPRLGHIAMCHCWVKEMENGNILEVSRQKSTISVWDAHWSFIKLSNWEWNALKRMTSAYA